MAQGANLSSYLKKPKRKRSGVHSKTKYSRSHSSSFYRKKYKGQGR